MIRQPYTLAMYRVKPGAENSFVAAWRELARTFVSLPAPPVSGTLIRSTNDPGLFYSFGPWKNPAHVAAMRAHPAAMNAFARIRELCIDVTPGEYEMIEHVQIQQ
ncbi:MAG TPA: antibiotic biosynthesis monooxygenase [Chthoniobacterales bacterium]